MLGIFRWVALIAAIVLIVALAGAVISLKPTLGPTQQQASEKPYGEEHNEKSNITLWDSWFPNTTAIFNLFLVFFTGVLAFVGIFQLNALNRAERISANIAQAAKDSADVAKKTLIATNRAWVAVPFMNLGNPLESGFPVTIQFRLVNVGKEPALGLVWSLKPRLIDYIANAAEPKHISDHNVVCDDLHPDIETGAVSWPETGTNFWVPKTFSDTPENEAIFGAAQSRTKSLIVDGCIAYITAGDVHKTWFSFFLRDVAGPSSAWNFNLRESGNGAD
jgi:hypothetical protein